MVSTRPLTVVESTLFVRQAEKIWNEAERMALVDFLARNPEAGNIIPGAGGVRKLRWGRAGIGKRGGSRAVYFFHHVDRPIFLLLAYAKAERGDMTQDEKRAVAILAAQLKGGRVN